MALPVAFGMVGSGFLAAIIPGRDHDLLVALAIILLDLAALAPLTVFALLTRRRRLAFGAIASLAPAAGLALVAATLFAVVGLIEG
jgi:hypothetical protein